MCASKPRGTINDMIEDRNPFEEVLRTVFGRTPDSAAEPAASTTVATADCGQSLAAATAGLLARFGVGDPELHHQVCGEVEAALDRLGVGATAVSLRFGVLTIWAAPPSARLLRVHRQRLLSTLQQSYSDIVSDLVIRPGRPRIPRPAGPPLPQSEGKAFRERP